MRSRSTFLCATLACAVLAAGCYKATFIRDPQAERGAEHDQWTSFFIFGLVGEQNLDVHEFCPAGRVAEVQTGANFATGLVTFVTLGIYAPRKVYVTCAADAKATLEIDADGQGRPVAAVRHEGSATLAARLTASPTGGVLVSFEESSR